MRERLTLAFVGVTVVLLLGGAALWTVQVQDRVSDDETASAQTEARALAVIVADRRGQGRAITEDDVREVISPTSRVQVDTGTGEMLDVAGPEWVDSADPVTAEVVTAAGQVRLERRPSLEQGTPWGLDASTSLAALLLLALLAGGAGYVVAQVLSAPFRHLASAAAALGRGRFDLALPPTRVPEALAIGRALESSAAQLRDRLEHEREFALHASHVLRTPLQGLRLRLEDLLGHPDLTDDAREAALGCLRAVGRLSESVGELVELSRRRDLVEGAAIPLRLLATQVAQRWSDSLADVEPPRALTAAVEGQIELPFTPGPVEQALEVVLDDVRRHGSGDVRLVFEAADHWLRVDVMRAAGPDPDVDGDADADRSVVPTAPERPPSAEARESLAALGGRIEELADAAAWRVHLPRR